jgi:hypothetical protein
MFRPGYHGFGKDGVAVIVIYYHYVFAASARLDRETARLIREDLACGCVDVKDVGACFVGAIVGLLCVVGRWPRLPCVRQAKSGAHFCCCVDWMFLHF